MSDFGADLRYARSYFRRKYTIDGVLDLVGLNAAADQVAACAQAEVLITANTFEGGSAQSQAKFNKMAAAQALEDLIREANPALPRDVDQTVAVFRRSCTTPCA